MAVSQIKLTRASKDLIEEAIEKAQSLDPAEICNAFSQIVTERYKANTSATLLEYQLGRMQMRTTGEVIRTVKYYLGRYGHQHQELGA